MIIDIWRRIPLLINFGHVYVVLFTLSNPVRSSVILTYWLLLQSSDDELNNRGSKDFFNLMHTMSWGVALDGAF
jgi:hypothetical protein